MGERHIYFQWLLAPANVQEYSTSNPETNKPLIWTCPYASAEVKLVKLWFSPNSGGWLFIRIMSENSVLAPRDGKDFGSDGFTTDDDAMPIYINRKVVKGDRLGFSFKNLDAVIHKCYVQFEVEVQMEKEPSFEHAELPDVPGTTKSREQLAKARSTVSPIDKDSGGW